MQTHKERARKKPATASHDGEFLWLVSLSDLMILLFVFFVVLFSFNMGKTGVAQVEGGTAKMDEVQKKILKWVTDKKLLDSVSVIQKEDGIILQIKEQMLFRTGDYKVRDEALDIVEGIGRALEMIPPPYRIGIEGHTDDNPLRSKQAGLSDNWELSSKRAHSVLRALELKEDMLARTVLMGYGPSRPLAPNRNADGNPIAKNQELNRRVAVRIF